MLSFEGLKEAIKISQMSSSLKKSIGLENDNNEQLFDGDKSISKMRDPEEIQFIKGIGQFICKYILPQKAVLTAQSAYIQNLHCYRYFGRAS